MSAVIPFPEGFATWPVWLQLAYRHTETRDADRYEASARFRAGRFTSSLTAHLMDGWQQRASVVVPGRHTPASIATAWVRDRANELKASKVNLAFDEQAIRDHAENYARMCSRMATLADRVGFAKFHKVAEPKGAGITEDGKIKRFDDPMWWRRQLRKVWTRNSENAQRELGMVRKGKAPYASDDAVKHRRAQKRRGLEYLKNSQLVDTDTGEQLELLPVVEKSVSNPALRRAEFMTRARGFEEISQAHKHTAQFWTLTAPSFFHAQLSSGGANPKFQRAVVRDAQQWLCKMWARSRAKFKRLSIMVYGFRIAEPHHDGTPHWHLLLFMKPSDAPLVEKILHDIWLSEYSDEAGAEEARTKLKVIDPEQGSATGYVAKYVSKNIDGHGAIGEASDDETGAPITDGIERVSTWASVHGIRQFQQIGGPAVGLWREARRLRDPVEDADIERIRLCADRGNWHMFTNACGGIYAGRKTNVKFEREKQDEPNKYGEARNQAIIGLRYASAVEITRLHRWRIISRGAPANAEIHRQVKSGNIHIPAELLQRHEPAPGYDWIQTVPFRAPVLSPLGPVAITVRSPAAGVSASGSWRRSETTRYGPN